jgi:hypothetical protein
MSDDVQSELRELKTEELEAAVGGTIKFSPEYTRHKIGSSDADPIKKPST